MSHEIRKRSEIISSPYLLKVFGDGLEKGIVDEPNTFTIETKNAGAGGLGLAIEGPSEALMQCEDNKDGTATGRGILS